MQNRSRKGLDTVFRNRRFWASSPGPGATSTGHTLRSCSRPRQRWGHQPCTSVPRCPGGHGNGRQWPVSCGESGLYGRFQCSFIFAPFFASVLIIPGLKPVLNWFFPGEYCLGCKHSAVFFVRLFTPWIICSAKRATTCRPIPYSANDSPAQFLGL